MEVELALTAANFAACSMVGWAAFCRLNLTHKFVMRKVRIGYVGLFVGATACGWQPVLFNTLPNGGTLMLACGVLAVMLAGMTRWKNGVPHEFLSQPGDLS